MHTLIGRALLDDGISWQINTDQKEEGLTLLFQVGSGHLSERDALKIVREIIERNSLSFVRPSREVWQLDVEELRQVLSKPDLAEFRAGFDWLTGIVNTKPVIVHYKHVPPPPPPGKAGTFTIYEERTRVELPIFKEEYVLYRNAKLFLSHKGVNKPMVREYFNVLKTLGFEPWLDEDAMPWGTNLERGILQGFKESCAAIFFITPEFKDENFLATEIEYAIREKREKGDRFAIIAIAFRDDGGKTGEVPALLSQYVYGEPKSQLEALNGIVKAIPIQLGPVSWKVGS